jgi:hypothetical protein
MQETAPTKVPNTSIIRPGSESTARSRGALQSRIWASLLRLILLLVLSLILAACGQTTTLTQTPEPLQAVPTQEADSVASPTQQPGTVEPSPTVEFTPTPTVDLVLELDAWKQAPVVPVVSDRAREIFETGVALGNDPRRFSKIGDSETFTSWFLAPFDGTPASYRLGEYEHLQAVIDQFAGSYARQSVAARQGFNAASVFAPLWADPTLCEADETPLACEFRLHQPGYVFVLLGTNDIWHLDTFEEQMRRIIEFSIEAGVLPILGTKADNLEGDDTINRTLYALAIEYDIPLWNFWAAVQDLPQAGLDEDQAHLTFGYNHFDDPKAMLNAWPVRNLTALLVLDSVWRGTQP